jgi:AraC family ethanolamine operon transcriptional activator
MMRGQDSERVLERDFDDFDELSESLEGLDLEFRQLDTGPFEARLRQLQSEQAILARGESERALEQRGTAAPKAWTFAIPAQGCSPFVWRGEHVSSSDIAVLRSDMEMDAVSRDGFSIYAFSVSEEHLAQLADEMAVPLVRRPGQTAVLRGANARAGSLHRLFDDILRRAADGSSVGGALDAVRRLDLEAPRELIACLHPNDWPQHRAQSRLRKEVFDRARAHVVSTDDESVTVQGLCLAAGTNQRTLHRAFQENCRVSPKTYLQAYRLNGARKQLRRFTPRSGTVGSAANRGGLWDMGQLAAADPRQFGELPSATLARMDS